MKLSKVIEILENMIESIDDQLKTMTDKTLDSDGNIDHKKLVDELFQWNFGRISKMVEEKQGYKLLLGTLKNSDWNDTDNDKMTIDMWLDYQVEKFRKLAMLTPSRGSNQANNLLESYKREARKEVYEWLEMIKEDYNGIDIDT